MLSFDASWLNAHVCTIATVVVVAGVLAIYISIANQISKGLGAEVKLCRPKGGVKGRKLDNR